jgi:hypothetical protein
MENLGAEIHSGKWRLLSRIIELKRREIYFLFA